VVGAQVFLATDPPTSEAGYDPLEFLKGFSLLSPIAPAVVGTIQRTELSLPLLLDDPLVDPEEHPIDVPRFDLAEPAAGTDPAQPDFALLDGFPRVSVEGLSPGQSQPVTVGAGIAFAGDPGEFVVRSAYPGAVDSIDDMPTPPAVDLPGQLVLDGTILPDLMVRCEFVDGQGNRSGARPHLSALGADVPTMNVPTVLAPVPEGPAGGLSFNLAFVNSVADGFGGNALYEAVLRDQAGRRWRLLRHDVGNVGNPNVVIHVPELAGATGLMPGDVFCTVSAFVFPASDLSLTSFLWSDLGREHHQFAHAAVVRWDYPN
jgi:hypothetical protein